MPTLIIFIVFSLIMLLFYWFKGWMTDAPYRKRWTFSKAKIALGCFLLFFGANRLFVSSKAITLIICILFIVYGLFIIYYSYKQYRYYTAKMLEEASQGQGINNDR
ncbi:hypothetical protein GCM10011391_33620 [Pullulanibacillus camelliae]|uniref:YtpI-like protein n=1 Tax=Pullulanibacillus camelliae TaxID=1707096 RepID=A0A8J2YLT9_9BACL|nr:YtpI family protein [Pullulanibacillus camelliae]GGE52087.1 hypothetical protein GCM10011391_33620 [Pullulanibacillus camelliae]